MITARRVYRSTVEPISLTRVKQHLIVDHDDDDELIKLYRDTAIEHVEDATRRTLTMSSYRMQTDGFSPVIELRNPPVRGVTELSYLDSSGDQQLIPVSDLNIKTDYEWLQIRPKTSWPAGSDLEFFVVAGYGVYDPKPVGFPYSLPVVLGASTGEDYPLPRPLLLAVLLLTAHWYENRETSVIGTITANLPAGVDALLFKYRNYKA